MSEEYAEQVWNEIKWEALWNQYMQLYHAHATLSICIHFVG
jgi:hypothetical protein